MKITGNEIVLEKLMDKFESKSKNIEIKENKEKTVSTKKGDEYTLLSFIVEHADDVLYDSLIWMVSALTDEEGEKVFVEKSDGSKITWNEYKNLSDEEKSSEIFRA